ncbi:hypothetical protein Tco_0276840 [Tanacetum coccineum]
MPPKRLKKKSIKRLVEKYVAKAIEEYEKSRANLDSAGSSGGNPGNAGGTMNVHGCSHKTFMNGKPHTFNGTEGVCWDYGLDRKETALRHRFHELALMCPELVPTEKNKTERYTRGFPERIKENITSSKPATLHDAINMARELETAKAYAATPTKNRGYAGNLPKCNRCNFHHSGRCPPKCQLCQRTGHLEKDCRAILPGACNDFLQNAMCYGCGEKGHLKNKYPKAGNQYNEGARARAYVVVENLQQIPNVVTGTFLLNDHYACILFDSGAEKSL